MADSAQAKRSIIRSDDNSRLVVDFFLALGLLGFSFSIGWMLVLFGTSLFTEKIQEESLAVLIHLILSGAVTVTFGFTWRFSDSMFKHRKYLLAVAPLLSSANLWMNLLPFVVIDSSWFILSWSLTGVGFAFFVLLWSEFTSLLQSGQAKPFFALAMFLGILWSTGFLLMFPLAASYSVYLLPSVTTIVLVILHRHYRPLKMITYIDRKSSAVRLRLSWKSILCTVVSSMALGFMLSWLVGYEIRHRAVLYPLVFFVGLASLVVIVDSIRWKKLGENFVMRIFLPLVASGMLPLVIANDLGRAICCVIMICGLIFVIIQGTSALNEHIVLFNLAPMHATAFGRGFSYAGVCAGLALGYGAFHTMAFGDMTLAIVTIFLVCVLVIVAMSVMMENNYPLDETSVQPMDIYTLSDTSFLYTNRIINPGDTAYPETSGQVRRGEWKRRCDAVAAAYGLSPRQSEVLILLAKGRDAEYVAKQFVISLHTAKAHIYNIYQKTNVHSRQELIDLIESVELSKT